MGTATPEDRQVWRVVQARVADSLPEYRVAGIDRLQNAALWRQYALRRRQLAEVCNGDANEMTLFHYSTPQVIRMIIHEGFETRLAREGEVHTTACKRLFLGCVCNTDGAVMQYGA